MRKQNILIFPAGSEIGLEIYNSLVWNRHTNIYGASGKADHAKFVYPEEKYFEDNFYVNDPDFVTRFNELLVQLEIDVIYPTHDTITLALAKFQPQLSAKVITSPYESALIAREKKRIYSLFKSYDFCPIVYPEPYSSVEYPVFLKPDIGEGGKGTGIAHNKEELVSAVTENQDLIACELLPGEELSVDCFTDRHGVLRFIGPRTRERITIGISFNSKSVPLTTEVESIAQAIHQEVKLRGAWFFQVKKDSNGKFKLLEFAVRQSSTMGVYRHKGINFALLSMFDALDMDISFVTNKPEVELDRRLENRYNINYDYDKVYIDFDETIVTVDFKVNELAMKYLYQCRNKGLYVALITKHLHDIRATLAGYAISEALFDDIIVIGMDEDKSDHMDPNKSIFIDNYFFEREKVAAAIGIPVFDVDGIQSLIK